MGCAGLEGTHDWMHPPVPWLPASELLPSLHWAEERLKPDGGRALPRATHRQWVRGFLPSFSRMLESSVRTRPPALRVQGRARVDTLHGMEKA